MNVIGKILCAVMLLISMATSSFSQLVITTNTAQNKLFFKWPMSLKNTFLYEFNYYTGFTDKWRATTEYIVTSDGTNYYSYAYIVRPHWPTSVDYQLRPSFSAIITWPAATDSDLSFYDIHFCGTGGLPYGRTADKTQTSITFPWLDPTMLPWYFYVYKRTGVSANSAGWQIEISRTVITTANTNVSPPQPLIPPSNVHKVNF